MDDIEWSTIDDYLFVKIVGEILARLGFVDIDYQGDGPDGGVDIFATELVPFAIQGRTPFRWAIQCKFSDTGLQNSVNDREIRDVEGILRPERYLAQDPRGYMLITNRRIVQNVIERLRGVDRRSQYRTARLDGAGLNSVLGDHPEISNRYFGCKSVLDRRVPQLVVTPVASGFSGKSLARVAMEIRTTDSGNTKAISSFGIIDTGAQITCIPRELVDEIGAPIVDEVNVHAVIGGATRIPCVRVDLVVERLLFRDVVVVAADVKYVLLGMDLLKGLSICIEPSGTVVVYDKPEA